MEQKSLSEGTCEQVTHALSASDELGDYAEVALNISKCKAQGHVSSFKQV